MEAYLYEKLGDKKAQCRTCAHYCVLKDGEKGKCGVRENKKGKIYSLTYGKPCAINIDPIEKKPFFHFLPGSMSLSVATVGCNFACANCQNWTLSQNVKTSKEIEGDNVSPKKLVEIAKKNNLPSISFTYTEPTVFLEYALDTMKLAKKAGLKTAWVTNGFLSEEALELVFPYLDAANVDLKSFSAAFYRKYCGGRLSPVLDTLKRMKKHKVWVEITTLLIPGLNDSEENTRGIALFIKNELGPETPWHISRFCGRISWQLQNIIDTPLSSLEKAYKIGIETGLKYVYLGNTSEDKRENTFCPRCNERAILRKGFSIMRLDEKGKCPRCKESLNILE